MGKTIETLHVNVERVDWNTVTYTYSHLCNLLMYAAEMLNFSYLCSSDPLPPSEVIIETAATTTTSVKVNWVYESDESYITQWRLEYTVKGIEAWAEATTTSDETTLSYFVNGLMSGQTYVMRVFGITVTNLDSQTASQADATVSKYISVSS